MPYQCSQPNLFSIYSIPRLNKLDKALNHHEDDCTFEPYIKNGRIDFYLYLAPCDYFQDINHVSIRYEGMFSLVITAEKPNPDCSEGLDEHFITIAPKFGIYKKQKISNDQALIAHHQMLHQTKGLILYSPNGEGIYKAVFSVPMSRPPDLHIDFHDKGNVAEVVKATKSVVTFRIKKRSGSHLK